MLIRTAAAAAVALVALVCGCGGSGSVGTEKRARFVVNPTEKTTGGGYSRAAESEVVVALPDGKKLTLAEARSMVEHDTGFVKRHCPCTYESDGEHVKLVHERHP